MNRGCCTGFGSQDTHSLILNDGRQNEHPSAGTPYGTITPDELVAMVANPPTEDKHKAQWIIPSAYVEHDGRSHAAQRNNGSYWWLAADIDKGSPSIVEVLAAVRQTLGPDIWCTIYSTASSTSLVQKWRVFVGLAKPLTGKEYGAYQAAWFDALEHAGLILDRALERAGQLIFLPNRGEWYEYAIDGASLLNAQDHPMAGRAAQYQADTEAAYANLRDVASNEGSRSHLRAFRMTHSIDELLQIYGFECSPTNADLWRHPSQHTSNYGSLRIMRYPDGDRWVSRSDTINAMGFGRPTPSGSRMGDQFDLYVHFNCQGNQDAAVLYAKECLKKQDDLAYGAATAAHGQELFQTLWVTGEPLGPDAKRAMVEAQQEEIQKDVEFEAKAIEAEGEDWKGDWVNDVPFKIKPGPLEWAAWHAPGIIGKVVRSYAPYASRASLVPILAGAIAATCSVSQGRYVLQYGQYLSPPSIPLFLVGDSGIGKEDANKVYRAMVSALEDSLFMMTREVRTFKSGSAGAKTMQECSEVILINQEGGALLNAQRGNEHAQGAKAYLTAACSSFMTGMSADIGASENTTTARINVPCVSSIMSTTPENVAGAFDSSDAESGWLGRFVFMYVGDAARRDKIYVQNEQGKMVPQVIQQAYILPEDLKQEILKIAGIDLPQQTVDPQYWPVSYKDINNVTINRSYYKHRLDDDGLIYIDELEQKFEKLSKAQDCNHIRKPVLRRAAEMVTKMGHVGTCAKYTHMMQTEELQWATIIIQHSLDKVTPALSAATAQAATPYDQLITRIKRQVVQGPKRKNDIRYKELPTGLWMVKREQLIQSVKGGKVDARYAREQVNLLVEDGTLITAMDLDGKGGSWFSWAGSVQDAKRGA